MLGKAILGCFGAAMSLAALAFAAAQLREDQGSKSGSLELLTTIFVVACLVAIVVSLLLFVAFLALWGYRYFHAVGVIPGQWYPRYWPLQRIAQVGGVFIKHEDWAGDIKLVCEAQFGSDKTTFTRTVRGLGSGTYGIEFPQQPVDFLDDPKEGDTAIIVVKAIPAWWRGRPTHLTQQASIGVTDHRPAESRGQSQS
jgi:MFS family permease